MAASLLLGGLILAPCPLAAQRTPQRPLETADVAALATPATVTIIALGRTGDTLGQGSGFILRSDGVLVTNFHVMRGATGALVLLSSGERFTRVHVLDADSVLDLALLKIPGAGLTALQSRTTTPRVGERVVAIGSPLGLTRTVTDGIVSATRMVAGRELVQISAPISPGSSGGAVLDAFGRVFAVSTSQLNGGQALNFAVPVRYALGMLGDMPRDATIAEVFGGLEAGGAGRSGPPASGTAASADARLGFTRHPHPRASVEGSYSLTQVWFDAKGDKVLEQFGYLFATKDVGFLVLANRRGKDQRGPTRIYNVRRWRTNDAGDLILVAGGATYDGFQTADDGFLAYTSLFVGTDSVVKLTLGAVPTRLPLSRNDGLFAAKSRSHFVKDGRESTEPGDWGGDAAIAFASDTIYVDLKLSNAAGGTTAFVGHGALVDHESFDLSDSRGSTLKGWVRDGSMYARFFDKREGSAFIHTVQAERR